MRNTLYLIDNPFLKLKKEMKLVKTCLMKVLHKMDSSNERTGEQFSALRNELYKISDCVQQLQNTTKVLLESISNISNNRQPKVPPPKRSCHISPSFFDFLLPFFRNSRCEELENTRHTDWTHWTSMGSCNSPFQKVAH